MEIPKLPAADALSGIGSNVTAGQDRSTPPAAPLPAGDLALIRALNVNSALQILLTEVRDALGPAPQSAQVPLAQASSAQAPSTMASSSPGPAEAARVTLDAFLQALPAEPLAPAPWLDAVEALQNTVVTAMERAIATVAAWRDASPPVVDAVRDSRVLVLAALSAEVVAPPPRAEWAGLAPALTRFRRRRRRARRILADPEAESSTWTLDDSPDPFDYD